MESFVECVERACRLGISTAETLRELYPFVIESQGADLGQGRMLVPLARFGTGLAELARRADGNESGPALALVRVLLRHAECAVNLTIHRVLAPG